MRDTSVSWAEGMNERTHCGFPHPALRHSLLISPATSLSDTVNSFCAASNQSKIQMQGPCFFSPNEPFLCKMSWLLSNSSNPLIFWGRAKLLLLIWEINRSCVFSSFSRAFGKFQHNQFYIFRTRPHSELSLSRALTMWSSYFKELKQAVCTLQWSFDVCLHTHSGAACRNSKNTWCICSLF